MAEQEAISSPDLSSPGQRRREESHGRCSSHVLLGHPVGAHSVMSQRYSRGSRGASQQNESRRMMPRNLHQRAGRMP